MLVCDTPQKLKDSIVGGDIVDLQLEKAPPTRVVEELKGFKEIVDVLQLKPLSLRLYLNQVEEVVPRIMNLLMKQGIPITSMRMSEPSLDDVFAHYTGLSIEEAQKDEGGIVGEQGLPSN